MTYLQAHVVELMLVLGGAVFFVLLLSPLIVHLQWEKRQRRRGGRRLP